MLRKFTFTFLLWVGVLAGVAAQDDPLATLEHTNGIEMQITAFEARTRAGDFEPGNGVYLIMLAKLHNTSSRRQCVFARDVRLVYEGDEYAPERPVMDALRHDLDRSYIGPILGECLKAGGRTETFVAFDAPANMPSFTVRFDEDTADFDDEVFGSNAPEATLSLDNEAAQQIMDGLSIVAGGRKIEQVAVADGRDKGGERVAIITYTTTESSDAGLVEEVLDIFSGVAASARANDIDLDSVMLIPGNADGKAAGFITTQMDDLMAWHTGDITRAEFLRRLSVTSL